MLLLNHTEIPDSKIALSPLVTMYSTELKELRPRVRQQCFIAVNMTQAQQLQTRMSFHAFSLLISSGTVTLNFLPGRGW